MYSLEPHPFLFNTYSVCYGDKEVYTGLTYFQAMSLIVYKNLSLF